ncbi:MAG: amidophosphoribosyltransferase [Helicobacteraceae bacterium]|nr:amidophosphoribosyltransferase [Helicobacteraceae bacterium]
MLDDLNEKCAVVGVFGNDEASKMAFLALHAQQHRGQEAAGISSADGVKLHLIKNRGLVTKVFNEDDLENTLVGRSAIGHTRYSTAGDDSILDAQPVFARYNRGEMAIVHNGNLTNAAEVRADLIEKGAIFQTYMDTENLIHLIAKNKQAKLLDRIIESVKTIQGAFSLVFLSRKKMFAMRDAHGFRPLSLGKLGDGYIVASETCAFDIVGAEFIRDVEPGELLIFEDGKEPQSIKVLEPTPKHCIFEYVYFARPDSNVFGQNVYEMRKNMGKALAHEKPVEGDLVIPVPDGGVPAAIGYAQESGIPFEMGIMRNHYIGRTFIEPTQEIRDLKVKMKLSPVTSMIKGKRVIVIDDSIVRGTTSMRIIRMLKEAGAAEVHMRISSPPTTDPCYYGVDTPDKDKLIASSRTCDEICEYIGADSLSFLSNDALLKSVNSDSDKYCTACFTGEYIV